MGSQNSKSKCPPPKTVDYVDIHRYLGKWYDVAQIPKFYTWGGSKITAQYSMNQDGSIKVMNKCIRFGGQSGGPAKAVITDKQIYFSERFDLSGAYWIVRLGQNYEYSVVSDDTYDSLFILCRQPQMSKELYDDIIADLNKRGGFRTDQIQKIKQ